VNRLPIRILFPGCLFFQVLIEKINNHFVDFGGVEFRAAVAGVFDDVQLCGHFVFLECFFQDDTLMHGDRGVLRAVNDQEGGILLVNVSDRVGPRDAVFVLQDRSADQQ